jgi:hypothetical protein
MSEPLIDVEGFELSQWIDRLVVIIVRDVVSDLIGPIEAKHSFVPEGDTRLVSNDGDDPLRSTHWADTSGRVKATASVVIIAELVWYIFIRRSSWG